MTDEERFALGKLGGSMIMQPLDEILAIKSVIDKEVEQRNLIDSKEKAVALAEKVQNETGNDQSVDKLKAELHVARRQYAIWSSEEPLYYLPKAEDRLQPLESKRLKPIQVLPQKAPPLYTDRPVWEISQLQEDGTERHLGYSYGEPGYENKHEQ